jgi:hypothetical protein
MPAKKNRRSSGGFLVEEVVKIAFEVPSGWKLKGFYTDKQGRIRPILVRI